MIRMVVENAHKCGKWAGICGELGADLELTDAFMAVSYTHLHLTVGVEGETQGNGYQLTLAKLRMNFATEKVAQDTVTTIEKTEKTEVRGEDKVITTTKRVKTGDTNLMLRYSAVSYTHLS